MKRPQRFCLLVSALVVAACLPGPEAAQRCGAEDQGPAVDDPFGAALPADDPPVDDPFAENPFAEPAAPKRQEKAGPSAGEKVRERFSRGDASPADLRQQARLDFRDGNCKDAYESFRVLLSDPKGRGTPAEIAEDFEKANSCLRRLARVGQLDGLREAAAVAHADNWLVLWEVAKSYRQSPHTGRLVAGEFIRGSNTGDGQAANAIRRDRARALQLMAQAVPQLPDPAGNEEVADFYSELAGVLLGGLAPAEPRWLLDRTDLGGVLPDYDDGSSYDVPRRPVPSDADGRPVFPRMPAGLDAARNDLERWLWCLKQAETRMLARKWETARMRADCLHALYGVRTLVDRDALSAEDPWQKSEELRAATRQLHTLGDHETIARLAGGIRRFDLPEEYDFIRMYRQLAESGRGTESCTATLALARIYEDRRQYAKAVAWWQEHVRMTRERTTRKHLNVLVGNWGQFEPVGVQPAGRNAKVQYRFRNGRQVDFSAQKIDVRKMLADAKARLRARGIRRAAPPIFMPSVPVVGQADPAATIPDVSSGPGSDLLAQALGGLGWGSFAPYWRHLLANVQRYAGPEVASWTLDLEVREGHLDRRITVTTPLTDAGVYLLSAKMAGGNTSKIVLWLTDLAIAEKPLAGKTCLLVAEAATGRPVAEAKVKLLGVAGRNWGPPVAKELSKITDADGLAIVDAKELGETSMNWVTARTADGRFGYYGTAAGQYPLAYRDVPPIYDSPVPGGDESDQTKVYAITDRPVYRPGHTVHFKVWVRRVRFPQEDRSCYAYRYFSVKIHDPKGQQVLSLRRQADAYGGIEGHVELPEDAVLGEYKLEVEGKSRRGALGPNLETAGGTFRVEEYKKPEFEVEVEAPTDPLALGEKITATIRARYYFGEPVREAMVKYTVTRAPHEASVWPSDPWDWLYGPGYWWCGYDYVWYPGWSRWGLSRSHRVWGKLVEAVDPPELVLQEEVPIGPEGTVKVEIDTGAAKAEFPGLDHRYTITAEVVDLSRRTIVARGEVLVARKPFSASVAVDRGFYEAGDPITATVSAARADRKPVAGKALLRLLRIEYRDAKPVETEVARRELAVGADGRGETRFEAKKGGQYRLACRMTDRQGHSAEAGHVFNVLGDGFDGSRLRFDHIELIPQKRNYRPGQTARVLLNVGRPDATVMLTVRPGSEECQQPRVIRIKGKSMVLEIPVLEKDVPNFFVDAATVFDARVYSDARQITVPPASRLLNVEVLPSSATYEPGQKAEVDIRLTDAEGRPFAGSTVVAVYDKSVEHIAGDLAPPEIRSFFWKWRRTSQDPALASNLSYAFPNMVPDRSLPMPMIGRFGATVPEDLGNPPPEVVQVAVPDLLSGDFWLYGFGGGIGGFGGRGQRPFVISVIPVVAPAAGGRGFGRGAMGGFGGLGGGFFGGPREGAAIAQRRPEFKLPEPTVRKQFADTALWVGRLKTNSNGTARVALAMPENLTTWRIKVWAMGHGTKVGQGQADVVTRKDLILRMQTPRFAIERDEVVLSANVHNYLGTGQEVQVLLELDGPELESLTPARQSAFVAPESEARVDWRVKVRRPGEAVVRMSVDAGRESDAVEMRFPVHVHGIVRTESFSGAIEPAEEEKELSFVVPEERPDQARLEVRFSPTLAASMIEALPYMVGYPYGCTEQTLNRFLPTVIVQKVLADTGFDLEEVYRQQQQRQGKDVRSNRRRHAPWPAYDRNPVFDNREVARMVTAGVRRLAAKQCSDGGWGWFSGRGERSDAHMTALVVHGLQIARQNGVKLPDAILERGVKWLENYQDEQLARFDLPEEHRKHKQHADNLDAFVQMVLTDAEDEDDSVLLLTDAGHGDHPMLNRLYKDRKELSVYGLAMLGLALEKLHQKDMLAMVLRNLRQYLVTDDEQYTACLKTPEGEARWRWYGSPFEAQAYYLKLLTRTDPKGETAKRLVKHLLFRRPNGAYWCSTRDTALCVEAIADFLHATGEDRSETTVDVWLDGRRQKQVRIAPRDVLRLDDSFVLEGEALPPGPHKLRLGKKGPGPLYYSALVTGYTTEDRIAPSGLEIRVRRRFYRLNRVDDSAQVAGSRGQLVDQKVEKYEREPLDDLATLTSGDLVEVELTVDCKDDYEYILVEDPKPAGFEPLHLRSGYTGNELGAYMELHDDRVVFFVRRLGFGRHSVSYRMRAETPGRFSALPATAKAMYAPELKANSGEVRLEVEERPAKRSAGGMGTGFF